MKFSTICIVSLFLAGCNTPVKSQLEKDPTVSSIFNTQEIADLEIILSFFEDQICDAMRTSADNPLACFDKFLETIAIAQGTGSIYIPIPYHTQHSMYAQLSEAAFTEVWQLGKGADADTGEIQWSIRLNPEGKYARFMDAVRQEHRIFHAYVESFLSTQSMSAVMIENILINYLQFRTDDVKVRLFLAIHYLTLNDLYERHGQPNPERDAKSE